MTPDARNTAPTAQTADPEDDSQDLKDWLRRARSASRASTSFVDTNYRKQWEDSIRAFNNQHPSDSKFSSPSYDKRSKLFRPKLRAVMRKNEAAAAAAFFSNTDFLNIMPGDPTDKAQCVSAELCKQLIQYRLQKTIPWFKTVLGALQDAQVTGVVVGNPHWNFDKLSGKDEPACPIIPIENFLFDPSANWMDIVNTSPYVIELMPTYVMDVKAKMKAGEWHEHSVSLANAGSASSTRIARQGGIADATEGDSRALEDYEIAWVQKHIHRRDGQDWLFYTLSDQAMLTDPEPLSETEFTNKRPYIVGCCVIEAHKVMPSSIPMLGRGIQDEANEVANSRIDNVKFALNKKWFAKRGVEVDVGGLVRNVPGGVVMMNDPINDVREVSWPDVTQSSYQEQQGLDMSMDELLGNFNPAALMTHGAGNAPARNMALLNSSNGTLVEYLLLTFVNSFLEPVLQRLVQLEQAYETDEVILGLAAKNSGVFQKYGIDQVTDELLTQEITTRVNVGMGATDPSTKLQKFITAMTSYTGMLRNPAPGINMQEVGKEIFGALGYQDGSRFFTVDNPQLVQAQQQMQQMQMIIQQLEQKVKDKTDGHQVGIVKTQITAATKLEDRKIQEENANKRNLATHIRALHDAHQDRVMTPNGKVAA